MSAEPIEGDKGWDESAGRSIFDHPFEFERVDENLPAQDVIGR